MAELPSEGNELGSLAKPADTGLGSLAQSARGKQLKTARTIMIVVGVLTIVISGIVLAIIPSQVKKEIDAEVSKIKAQGMVIDQAEVKAAEQQEVRARYLVTGVGLALGVVFVILGLLVYQYPVPATLLGLVLYVADYVIFGLMNPQMLYQGIIVKIIIVACLVKALQAAIAYEKQRSKEAAALEAGM